MLKIGRLTAMLLSDANSHPPQTSASVRYVSDDTAISVTITGIHDQAGSNPSSTCFFKTNFSSVFWTVARERIFMLSNCHRQSTLRKLSISNFTRAFIA